MKHISIFSIALLLSCVNYVQAIEVSQAELELMDQMGIIAREMIELKCLHSSLIEEKEAECNELDKQRLAVVSELHKAIDARIKARQARIELLAEQKPSSTETQEIHDTMYTLESAHSTSGDLA